MTEPMIAIEGMLRLPPLRALADPSLTFGREWSPMTTRPVQSQSEFPIAAARFETSYVEAVRLSDASSPYRATSLWGVFADGEIRQRMLQLMQSAETSEDAAQAEANPVSIPLAVTAPSDAPEVRPGVTHRPLKTAIAIACAALIAWLLFGHEQRPASDDPAAGLSSTGKAAAEPAAASQGTRIAGSERPASAQAVLPGVAAPQAASQADAKTALTGAKANDELAQAHPGTSSVTVRSAAPAHADTKTQDSAKHARAGSQANDGSVTVRSAAPVFADTNAPGSASSVTVRSAAPSYADAKAQDKAKHEGTHSQASAGNVTVRSAKTQGSAKHDGAQRQASNRNAAPAYASTKARDSARPAQIAQAKPSAETARAQGAARLAASESHRKRTLHAGASRRSATDERYADAAPAPRYDTAYRANSQQRARPSGAMNVEALYAILQHSPTLDSNVSSRQERRAADAPAN